MQRLVNTVSKKSINGDTSISDRRFCEHTDNYGEDIFFLSFKNFFICYQLKTEKGRFGVILASHFVFAVSLKTRDVLNFGLSQN